MDDSLVVQFLKDWQTGALVILLGAILGFVVGGVAGSALGPIGGVVGFAVGAGLPFAAYVVFLQHQSGPGPTP